MRIDWKRRFGIYGGIAALSLATLGIASGPAATASTNASGGDVFYEADCTNSLSAGVVAPFLIGMNVNAATDGIAASGAKFGATGTVEIPIIGPVIAGTAATGLIAPNPPSRPNAEVGITTSFAVGSTDGTATGSYTYTHTFPPVPAGAIGDIARKITKIKYAANSTTLTGPANGTFGASDVGMSVAYTNIASAADKRIDPLTVITAVAAGGKTATISLPTLVASVSTGDTLGLGKAVTFSDAAFNTGQAFTTAGVAGGKANIGIVSVTNVTENIAIDLAFGGTPGVEQGTGTSRKPACLLTGWGEPGDVAGPLQAGNVPPLTAPLLPVPPTTGAATALVLATGGFVSQPGTTQKITPPAAAYVTLAGGGTSSSSSSTSTSTSSTSTSTSSTSTSSTAPTSTSTSTSSTSVPDNSSSTTTSVPDNSSSTTTSTTSTSTSTSTSTTTSTAPETSTSTTSTSTTIVPDTSTTTTEPDTSTTSVPDTSTSTTNTTVVAQATTTTTVPIKQVTVHGTMTNKNACTSVLDPKALPDSNPPVTITISTDAFPQPHRGDPITLSKTKVTVAVDQGLLQTGVDGQLITDGMQIPSTVTLVVSGSNTKEGTHTYTSKTTSTVHVVADPNYPNGRALPLTQSEPLANTVWHPKNATDAVVFSEKSLKIVASLSIILGDYTDTITCAPSGSAQFVALAAEGTALPTTTTVPISAQGNTTTTVATPVSSNSLPRTGASTLLLLVVAAVMIDLGVCLIDFGRKRSLRRA